MSTLRLITSNSQRCLAAALADNLSKSPVPPLERETIVVLSNGMARWVSMELAGLHGVSAGVDFRFPNDLLDSCFRSALPDSATSQPFTIEEMTWRIASRLPELSQTKGFEQIAAYLGNGSDDRQLLQISRTLADTFDQYTIFRPELVMGWDNGDGEDWQPRLWRAISSECKGEHRAALLSKFGHKMTTSGFIPNNLPRRISLFGISYLPPFHLEALRLLSSHCEVACYLLNPCGQYWGNIISEKRMAGMELRTNHLSEAKEYYETGNPLLSSLGTLGQEFFESLLEYGFECEELDGEPTVSQLQTPADPLTLLATIKNDILTLNDRLFKNQISPISPNDPSLQIHTCHGPMREMEILYDNLLAIFDEIPDLEPRQVVVMIPDIENYAPYISAVFGNRVGGRPALPFSIADRSVRGESPFVEAFLNLLSLSSGRFGVNEVLNILEIPVVAARYDISSDELETLREWAHNCGVRWGLDGGHRAELGFPVFDDYSWQNGLDRLFLGYAMYSNGAGAFHGILPYPSIEGRQAVPLGKLSEFIGQLRRLHSDIAERKTLDQWADLLSGIVEKMLKGDDLDSAGQTAVARALNGLRESRFSSGFIQPVSLEAVRDILKQHLSQSGGGYGFMGGSITFCAMLPMRSIPMRVVCLAGMNDGQFPRTSRQPGFSLMSGNRKRGDRSLRDEDRYLFLEALMSAEERLYISYNGQSNRDNSIIPPSVLVSELQDYVGRFFIDSQTRKAPQILRCHRLQGFSSAYFDSDKDTNLFSYDQESCQAIEERRLTGFTQHAFISGELTGEELQSQRVDIRQLRRFLANPAAAFLERRMRISPFSPEEETDEREPFAVDGLSGYSLAQELVSHILQGGTSETVFCAVRSRGILPPLTAGKAAFDAAWSKSALFAAKVAPHLGEKLDRLEIDIELDDFRISGILDDITAVTQLRWRCTGMKGKDRLYSWLDHLLLNFMAPAGYPRESIMIASDLSMTLPPIENAAEILTDLLTLYAEGMRRPLPFFPQTSWDFLTDGIAKAEKSWNGDKRIGIPGESDNQSVRLCFGEAEPFGEEFCRLSERVYAPLKAILTDQKLT